MNEEYKNYLENGVVRKDYIDYCHAQFEADLEPSDYKTWLEYELEKETILGSIEHLINSLRG